MVPEVPAIDPGAIAGSAAARLLLSAWGPQTSLIILLAQAASLFGTAPAASRLCVPNALFYYRNGPGERRIGLAWGGAPVIIAALGDLIRGLK